MGDPEMLRVIERELQRDRPRPQPGHLRDHRDGGDREHRPRPRVLRPARQARLPLRAGRLRRRLRLLLLPQARALRHPQDRRRVRARLLLDARPTGSSSSRSSTSRAAWARRRSPSTSATPPRSTLLRELGVTHGQGFHLGEPQPLASFLARALRAADGARVDRRSLAGCTVWRRKGDCARCRRHWSARRSLTASRPRSTARRTGAAACSSSKGRRASARRASSPTPARWPSCAASDGCGRSATSSRARSRGRSCASSSSARSRATAAPSSARAARRAGGRRARRAATRARRRGDAAMPALARTLHALWWVAADLAAAGRC